MISQRPWVLCVFATCKIFFLVLFFHPQGSFLLSLCIHDICSIKILCITSCFEANHRIERKIRNPVKTGFSKPSLYWIQTKLCAFVTSLYWKLIIADFQTYYIGIQTAVLVFLFIVLCWKHVQLSHLYNFYHHQFCSTKK